MLCECVKEFEKRGDRNMVAAKEQRMNRGVQVTLPKGVLARQSYGVLGRSSGKLFPFYVPSGWLGSFLPRLEVRQVEVNSVCEASKLFAHFDLECAVC